MRFSNPQALSKCILMENLEIQTLAGNSVNPCSCMVQSRFPNKFDFRLQFEQNQNSMQKINFYIKFSPNCNQTTMIKQLTKSQIRKIFM